MRGSTDSDASSAAPGGGTALAAWIRCVFESEQSRETGYIRGKYGGVRALLSPGSRLQDSI